MSYRKKIINKETLSITKGERITVEATREIYGLKVRIIKVLDYNLDHDVKVITKDYDDGSTALQITNCFPPYKKFLMEFFTNND